MISRRILCNPHQVHNGILPFALERQNPLHGMFLAKIKLFNNQIYQLKL